MSSSISGVEELRGLVRESVIREKVAEGQELWRAYGMEDGFPERVRDVLFELKLDSERHLQTFLEVAHRLGMELDLVDLNMRAVEESLFEEKMTAQDVFNRIVEHDRGCAEFYSRVARSLEGSDLEDVDTGDVASVFHEIASEEEAHIEELEDLLNDPGVYLGGRII